MAEIDEQVSAAGGDEADAVRIEDEHSTADRSTGSEPMGEQGDSSAMNEIDEQVSASGGDAGDAVRLEDEGAQ